MKSKVNLCGLTRSEFEQLTALWGQKPFHGRQLYKWIYKHLADNFEEMTDLGARFRAELKERAVIDVPDIRARQTSNDGTEKFLFGLPDGEAVESVLIPDDSSGRMTLCISSQVGCPLGCAFCATGYLGYRRDLTVGEIVGQVMRIRLLHGAEAFDNVVFMGMGEPLLNYDNVMAAVGIMTDSLGLMVGAKRITISTAGVVPGIIRLAESGSKVNLAVSLNAADDEVRRGLMPIARSFPLAELLDAVRKWTAVRKRRVTFEYILFKGINDSEADARALANLIRGIACKINLLAYNPVDEAGFERPDDEAVDRFAQVLYPRAPAVTVRKSRGRDIDGACGQLAGRKGYSCRKAL